MDFLVVATITIALVAYGLVSRKLAGSLLTGPMLFSLFGLVVGAFGLGLITIEISNSALHLLAEVTLVLVLFADASKIDLAQLKRDHNLPLRMLFIGMPLSIILGAVVALLLFGQINIAEAALLAAILAPTDAALGQAVVSNPAVPLRIRMALNVESGLNDGLALPLVLVFAAMASSIESQSGTAEWLLFGAKQVGFGIVLGALVGYIGGKLVARCYRLQWMSESAEGMIAIGMAFGAFALAELVHGNGFISAFVAGLVFANTLQQKCQYLYEFAESEGQILVLLTFTAFGAVMLPQAIEASTYPVAIYAILSLTLIRMLAVRVSLIGTRVSGQTMGFLGWFGPRGLASILFVLLVLEQTELANKDTLFVVVVTTVGLSVFAHGISAGPAARWYGALSKKMGECEENRPVSQQPFSD